MASCGAINDFGGAALTDELLDCFAFEGVRADGAGYGVCEGEGCDGAFDGDADGGCDELGLAFVL